MKSHLADAKLYVYVPATLPAPGSRALVIVLHGGLGNGERVAAGLGEKGLNLNSVAEKAGFVVAYLDGTTVSHCFRADRLGWNAGGGCCGVPAERNVDDVGYIKGAIDDLVSRYHIDRRRFYGTGHSNGAMMTLRLICEAGVYAAAVSFSGPLNVEHANCSAAKDRRILSIHCEDDENVPIAGGRGTKGVARAVFNSEERTRQTFVSAGASFELQKVRAADHRLDRIESVIEKTEGVTLPQKVARFFGLTN